jgi:hypothetical protein
METPAGGKLMVRDNLPTRAPINDPDAIRKVEDEEDDRTVSEGKDESSDDSSFDEAIKSAAQSVAAAVRHGFRYGIGTFLALLALLVIDWVYVMVVHP